MTFRQTNCSTRCGWASNTTLLVKALSYRTTCWQQRAHQVEEALLVHCILWCLSNGVSNESSGNGESRLLAHRHNQRLCDLRSHCSTSCFLGAARPSCRLSRRKKTFSIQDSCQLISFVLSLCLRDSRNADLLIVNQKAASARSHHLINHTAFTVNVSNLPRSPPKCQSYEIHYVHAIIKHSVWTLHNAFYGLDGNSYMHRYTSSDVKMHISGCTH